MISTPTHCSECGHELAQDMKCDNRECALNGERQPGQIVILPDKEPIGQMAQRRTETARRQANYRLINGLEIRLRSYEREWLRLAKKRDWWQCIAIVGSAIAFVAGFVVGGGALIWN